MRIWSHENRYEFIEEPLQPKKIGVWAAISERRIIRYRNEILEPFVNQLHDDELQNTFFQQDEAPIHCTMDNLNFLTNLLDI